MKPERARRIGHGTRVVDLPAWFGGTVLPLLGHQFTVANADPIIVPDIALDTGDIGFGDASRTTVSVAEGGSTGPPVGGHRIEEKHAVGATGIAQVPSVAPYHVIVLAVGIAGDKNRVVVARIGLGGKTGLVVKFHVGRGQHVGKNLRVFVGCASSVGPIVQARTAPPLLRYGYPKRLRPSFLPLLSSQPAWKSWDIGRSPSLQRHPVAPPGSR